MRVLCVTFFLFFGRATLVAASIWSVIVTDTLDENIGPACTIDQAQMVRLSKLIAKATGDTLYLFVYETAEEFANSIDLLASLSIENEDKVFLYWSGHGMNDPEKGDWPLLFLQDLGVFTQLQYASLFLQKKPQLLVSITDCCNSYPKGMELNVLAKKWNRTGSESILWKLEKLFSEEKGVVFLTSAEPGEYSYCDGYHGGHLTYLFASSLYNLSTSATSWGNLLMNTKKAVCQFNDEQTPMYYYSPGPI